MKNAATVIEKQTPFVNAVIANGGVLGPITSYPPTADDVTIATIQEKYWDLPLEETRKMVDINLFGVYYTFTAFMHLLDAGNKHSESRGKTDFIRSQFIAVDSIGGLSRLGLVSHMYSSGKAAVAHLTRILATEFGKRGIRVNGITPGQYLTAMTEFLSGGNDTTQPGSVPIEQHPMTRQGGAEVSRVLISFLLNGANRSLRILRA